MQRGWSSKPGMHRPLTTPPSSAPTSARTPPTGDQSLATRSCDRLPSPLELAQEWYRGRRKDRGLRHGTKPWLGSQCSTNGEEARQAERLHFHQGSAIRRWSPQNRPRSDREGVRPPKPWGASTRVAACQFAREGTHKAGTKAPPFRRIVPPLGTTEPLENKKPHAQRARPVRRD